MTAVVFCFAEGSDHGHPGTVCLQLQGHDGAHDWTRDSEIFIPDPPQTTADGGQER
jgi:hypothetical protein